MSRTLWLVSATALAAGVGLVQASCTQVDCGDGTINRDGTCQPADVVPGATTCGSGTHLGTSGTCEPDLPPTMCDPSTTVEQVDPTTGVVTCIGVGGNCDSDIACPTPAPGKTTICGRLYNLSDDTKINDNDTTQCDPSNPTTTGPCSLAIQFYDAILFASDPLGTTPLNGGDYQSVYLDSCGRFRAEDLMIPTQGFIGVGVNDNPNVSTATHRLTGVALPVSAGKAYQRTQAYAIDKSTDAAWSTSAGLSGGTFADNGVYMALFRYHNDPVVGVTVTRSGAAVPSDSFYFTDSDPSMRTTPVPASSQATTGANGAALMVNDSGLIMHSGTGGTGLPGTCSWPSDLGATLPNVVYVQIRNAITTGTTNDCP